MPRRPPPRPQGFIESVAQQLYAIDNWNPASLFVKCMFNAFWITVWLELVLLVVNSLRGFIAATLETQTMKEAMPHPLMDISDYVEVDALPRTAPPSPGPNPSPVPLPSPSLPSTLIGSRRRPRPASYHGRTAKSAGSMSGGIRPLHLPLIVARSPKFNSDATLPIEGLGLDLSPRTQLPESIAEETTSSAAPPHASRSRRHSDASLRSRPSPLPDESLPAPPMTAPLLDEQLPSPIRHRRTTSIQTFLSQERASLLFRIEELESALQKAHSRDALMNHTIESMRREYEELVRKLGDGSPSAVGGDTPPGPLSGQLGLSDENSADYLSPPLSPSSATSFRTQVTPLSNASSDSTGLNVIRTLEDTTTALRPKVMLTSPSINFAEADPTEDDARGSQRHLGWELPSEVSSNAAVSVE